MVRHGHNGELITHGCQRLDHIAITRKSGTQTRKILRYLVARPVTAS